MFGLSESDSDSPAKRKEDDCVKVKNIYDGRLLLSASDIESMLRLGSKSHETDKKRPLLIQCTSEEKKWEMIRTSKSLKYLQNHVSFSLFAAPDRTEKEREERKKLLAQLKERRDNGEEKRMETIRRNRIATKLPADGGNEPLDHRPGLSGPICFNNIKNLHVLYVNARSIANKLNLLNNYLTIVNNHYFDLIFIVETWLTQAIADSMVCPNKYHIYRRDKLNGRGGGVLVLYKSHLHVSLVTSTEAGENLESITVDVYCNSSSSKKFRFSCFYVFPILSFSLKDVVNLCNSIDACFVGATPIYIFGDFNFSKIDWFLPFTSGGVCHSKFLDFCIQKSSLQNTVSRKQHIAVDTFLICYSVILQVQVFIIPGKCSPL